MIAVTQGSGNSGIGHPFCLHRCGCEFTTSSTFWGDAVSYSAACCCLTQLQSPTQNFVELDGFYGAGTELGARTIIPPAAGGLEMKAFQ